MKFETSIIIRTRNEERWIGRVLEKLFSQSYKNFQVVIVDSGSRDNTLSIISNFPTKLIEINSEDFSYPHALNIGAQNSDAEKYLCILSAHSLPTSDNWLEKAIYHLKHNDEAMGVYGPINAMPDGTFWDKFFTLSRFRELALCFPKNYRIIKTGGMGVLGFTNAVIRKELWEKYNFNEEYGAGGEDGDWANHWFSRGFVTIKDRNFTVHHSHYLGFHQWLEQFRYWRVSEKPSQFNYLKFRANKTHKK